MPFRSGDDQFDDYDQDSDEEFTDEEEFTGEEDQEPTIGCPYCGEEIYEDSDWCPHCGNFISREDAPRVRRPWWVLAGVAVCLTLVLLWVLLS